MKVDLSREVSAQEFMAVLKKVAEVEVAGGEFYPNKLSRGGQEVIVLGSARKETRGQVTDFYPKVMLPFLSFRNPFFQTTHIALYFSEVRPHIDGKFPSYRLQEGKYYSMVATSVWLVGKRRLFAPVLSWGRAECHELFFPKHWRGDINSVVMQYLSNVGDALKTPHALATA